METIYASSLLALPHAARGQAQLQFSVARRQARGPFASAARAVYDGVRVEARISVASLGGHCRVTYALDGRAVSLAALRARLEELFRAQIEEDLEDRRH